MAGEKELILGLVALGGLAVAGYVACKVKKETGKWPWQLHGKELWAYMNRKLRVFCDDVRQWLGERQNFKAKVIRFTVLKLDNARAGVERVINADAINAQGKSVKIEDRPISEAEAQALGIKDGEYKDINVDDLKN